MTRSIRNRVSMLVLASLIALLALCGILLYLYLRAALTKQFDVALLSKATSFAALSNQDVETYEATPVSLDALPAEVRSTVLTQLAGVPLTDLEKITRDGRVFFKVESTKNNMEVEFLVSGTGQYLGESDEFDFAFDRAALPEYQPSATAEYYHVWDEDGETIAKSPSLGNDGLLPQAPNTQSGAVFDHDLPDGRNGRVASIQYSPRTNTTTSDQSSERLTLAMARSRADLDWSLAVIRTGLYLTALFASVVATILVRLAVERGLRALSTVADEASTIDENMLAHRFPTEGMPQELVAICQRLNALLSRLDAAFRREQRFTADVAHELRTPIAELRALSEVGIRSLSNIQEGSQFSAFFSDALAIAMQMERVVSTLLTLARCQSRTQIVKPENVDLARLVRESWAPFEGGASAGELTAKFVLPGELPVTIDPMMFGLVLSNLFSNAIAYTPAGGTVHVELTGEGNRWQLSVSNTTDSIGPEDLPHMLEPFWRKDQARTDGAHSGIGLSLVNALVPLLLVGLRTEMVGSSTFRIVLQFPASTDRNAER